MGKIKSKNLSNKYNKKLLDHAKQSATDAIKTASKRAIQKTVKTPTDLTVNIIVEALAKSYNNKFTETSGATPNKT